MFWHAHDANLGGIGVRLVRHTVPVGNCCPKGRPMTHCAAAADTEGAKKRIGIGLSDGTAKPFVGLDPRAGGAISN